MPIRLFRKGNQKRGGAEKKMTIILDALSFKRIFVFWVILLFIFGLAYHAFSDDMSYLYQTQPKQRVSSIYDAIYFSFVTATTIGFGDIVPFGLFKALAISEVLMAIMLLAIVTSKLVSIKQNVILGEIYEISVNEKMYSLRSSLLLFRQHLERLINSIDDGSVKKREIANMHMHFVHFEDTLREAISIVGRSKGKQFLKPIDDVNAELILNSVLSSLQKIDDTISDAEKHKMEWRNECNTDGIRRCIELSSQFMSCIELSEEDTAGEVKKWFERVTTSLVERLPEKGRRRSRRC